MSGTSLSSFRFRQTANGSLPTKADSGYIKRIYGNTLIWNQLLRVYRISDSLLARDTTITGEAKFVVQQTVVTTERCINTSGITIPTNHKALCVFVFKSNFTEEPFVRYQTGTGYRSARIEGGYVKDTWQRISFISDGFVPGFGTGILPWTNCYVEGEYISMPAYGGFCVFDLTKMYGAGNEPTLDEFEEFYPLSSYPFNPGAFLNNTVCLFESVGFNQWDEEWEQGQINPDSGQPISADAIRSKNFIPVIAGKEYCFYAGEERVSYIFCYDAEERFISSTKNSSEQVFTFQIPEGVAFVKFQAPVAYGITYNHNICVNISNPGRNGTYEPYEKRAINIDLTKLKGKLNGVGESVYVAPDGLAGREGWRDYALIEGAYITKVVRVTPREAIDLGDFSWNISSPAQSIFRINNDEYPVAPAIPLSNIPANALSDKYTSFAWSPLSANDNMCFGIGPIRSSFINQEYTSIEEFKAAMVGTKLMYQVATPQEYVLDTPIYVGGFKADGLGTEKVIAGLLT